MRFRNIITGLQIGFGSLLVLVVFCSNAWIAAWANDPETPLPSGVWPTGPLDLAIAFPRPVNAEWARRLEGQTIPYFEPGKSGERRPADTPLGKLRIAGVSQSDQGRTLLLATDPHPRSARYELMLEPASGPGSTFVYDLSGVQAEWSEGKDEPGAEPAWKGWWPELDFESVRKLAPGSAPHQRLLELIRKPGRLVLSTQVVLRTGEARVRIESSGAVSEATLGDEQPVAGEAPATHGPQSLEFHVRSVGEPLFLIFTLETGPTATPPMLRGSFTEGPKEPRRFRPMERARLLLPWVPVAPMASAPALTSVPDLAGGDPRKGEVVFFGEQARCSQCHAFRGRGGTVGPELTDVGRKGPENLYRSIAAPSAEIAPDYVPYTIAARDGRVLAGVVRAEGAHAIRVTDTNAKVTTLQRDEIDQIRASGTSIMPVGLAGGLGEANLRDLIAFLTSEPPATRPER